MTHALDPYRQPVTISQTHLPVLMETDQFALDHVARLLAEEQGLDPLSVRNLRTMRVRTPRHADHMGGWPGTDVTTLTLTAEADRR